MSGTTNPASLLMDADKSVTAVFAEGAQQTYTLTVAVQGVGTVSPSPGAHPYAGGTQLGLAAVGSDVWAFDHWVGPVADPDANPTSILMDANKTVTAVFVPKRNVILTVNIIGEGTVSRTPDAPTYPVGTLVQLAANANQGWEFDRWESDGGTLLGNGEGPYATAYMTSDMTVTAVFKGGDYVLTLTADPALGGHFIVYDAYEGIVPGEGQYYFDPSRPSSVGVTAVPNQGYVFVRWSGALDSIWPDVFPTMDGNKSLTATFADTSVSGISVNVLGQGTLTPPGGNYNRETQVTLTATPASGWMLTALWLDGEEVPNGHSFVIAGRHVVSAVFQLERTLTVTIVGNGEVYPPTGSTFADGTTIVVEAIPDYGWGFDYWEGDAALTGATSLGSLPMTGNKNITARFRPLPTYTLTTSVTPTGGGSVVLNPAGGVYPEGTQVTVGAVPADENWTLQRWSGDLTGSENPTTITLDGNKSVTAEFLWSAPVGPSAPRSEFFLRLVPDWGKVKLDPEPDKIVAQGPLGLTWRNRCQYNDLDVTVTITPDPGLADRFTNFSGTHFTFVDRTTATATTVPIGSGTVPEVTANFSGVALYIMVASGGGGTTSPEPGVHVYERTWPYETVTLSAAPDDAGFEFDHWLLTSGGPIAYADLGSTSTENPLTVTMATSKVAVACFKGLPTPWKNSAVVIEGGGTSGMTTKAGDSLQHLNYNCDALNTSTNAEAKRCIPLYEVFAFNGHGNCRAIAIHYEDPEESLSYEDVDAVNDHPYKFVYLHGCGTAGNNDGRDWKNAFRAQSVVAWRGLTYFDGASPELDEAFWNRVKVGESTWTALRDALLIDCRDVEYIETEHPICNGSVRLSQ